MLKLLLKDFQPTPLIPLDPIGEIFTNFFKHRFNWIIAPAPIDGGKAEWRTEKRFPIRDRNLYDYWADPDFLVGVRFGENTRYTMIDIDAGGEYHPNQDPSAIKRIIQALEDIGLVSSITIQSSDSGGLHIYFPLSGDVSSFGAACSMSECLESHGFKITPGNLEIFPNEKTYGGQTRCTNYQGHRLPLQQGSYILDDALNPYARDLNTFVSQWQFAADQQDLELFQSTFTEARKARRAKRCKSAKGADKMASWLNDLNAAIERGWSKHSQSNDLLFDIAKRAVVFYGITDECELANHIVEIARSAPGFYQWCRDANIIYKRAREKVRSVFQKGYYLWGGSPNRSQATAEPRIDREAKKAQTCERNKQKIASAYLELKKSVQQPIAIRDQASAIAKLAGVSLSTLYDHKDLWHPEFLESCSTTSTNDFSEAENQESLTKSTATEIAPYAGVCETSSQGVKPNFEKSSFQPVPQTPVAPANAIASLAETLSKLSPATVAQNLARFFAGKPEPTKPEPTKQGNWPTWERSPKPKTDAADRVVDRAAGQALPPKLRSTSVENAPCFAEYRPQTPVISDRVTWLRSQVAKSEMILSHNFVRDDTERADVERKLEQARAELATLVSD